MTTESTEAEKATAKKSASKKSAAKKSTVKKTAQKATAKKSAAKKSATKATAKKAVTKKTASKKSAAKKTDPAITIFSAPETPKKTDKAGAPTSTTMLFQAAPTTSTESSTARRRTRRTDSGSSRGQAAKKSSSDKSEKQASTQKASAQKTSAQKTSAAKGKAAKKGAQSKDSERTSTRKSAAKAGAAKKSTDKSEKVDESTSRRRRRRRHGSDSSDTSMSTSKRKSSSDEVSSVSGSTRLEAKRQRRREGREAGRRRTVITEAEFLARRESVDRSMIIRDKDGRTQIAIIEDDVLVEHFVNRKTQSTLVGNVYLGRVQNVLPSMEAAFVDIGKGRNAVLYAGEVNWDAAGLEGQPRRIEEALKSGDQVLVQVTKDPIGHKGARLTSQVTLAGRYLVFVPSGSMTGISRKLPDNERARLKKLLKEIVPDEAGVIVRTAAEGASDDELRRDVERLQAQWVEIEKQSKKANAPALLSSEPDLAIRVVRDIFNEDFKSLLIAGEESYKTVREYIQSIAPDLVDRVEKYTGTADVFHEHRIDEQLSKGMDRKVWLPSGGSLIIDRTEAMTVIDVNTGKFTGTGGTLEETVTRNNLEAAEEIVRQLRLRDIGGIIVIDFIDMVLESNRDLVMRRLIECLSRDRTKHQVAEVTSLGLIQMTRKRVGQGLVEAFSEMCEHCNGRGFIVHSEPVEKSSSESNDSEQSHKRHNKKSPSKKQAPVAVLAKADAPERQATKAALSRIAEAAAQSHEKEDVAEEQDTVPEEIDAVSETIVIDDSPEPEAIVIDDSEPEVIVIDEPSEVQMPTRRSRRASRPVTTPRSLDEIVLPDRGASEG